MIAANQEADVLNDLIRINNDRIAGYEKAITETGSAQVDLVALFGELVAESRRFRQELIERVAALGAVIAKDTTFSGTLYRVWMDLKAGFIGTSRAALLESCAFGEDAWRKTYETVLANHAELPTETRQLITRQYNTEQHSADLIKKYRDAHATLS